MANPYVPLLLQHKEVKFLSTLLDSSIGQLKHQRADPTVLVVTNTMAEIKAKLDDALKVLDQVKGDPSTSAQDGGCQ